VSEVNEEYLRRIYFEQFRKEYIEQFQGEEPICIADLIEKIKVLEDFSLDKKRFFVLFAHKQFYPIYISENAATTTGYTLEELYKGGLYFAFKRIHWKQLGVMINITRWGKRYLKFITKRTSSINQKAYHCGWKFKDKWNKWHTLFIKEKVLMVTKDNHPSLSFIEIEDITSMYKADFHWTRFTNIADFKTFIRAYFSSGSKKEYADVLSSREIEILKLIIAKKTTIEISQLLNISKETILRHRKNMIARIGAKDITGLIYICRLCQLI